MAYRPLNEYRARPETEMRERARAFAADLARRRSVRHFSPRPVPREIIEQCLRAAATAPSGANQQPWHFVAVSDAATKRRIRQAAEQEERAFYGGRAPDEWLRAIAPLGTDADKPFLDTAPWLIVVFARAYGLVPAESAPPTTPAENAPGDPDVPGMRRVKHYYVQESVGLATGLLIAAVHHAGLASLTHTPSPMGFLREVLQRPANERAFLILVVGYPAEDATVPDITRKPFDAVATFVRATTRATAPRSPWRRTTAGALSPRPLLERHASTG